MTSAKEITSEEAIHFLENILHKKKQGSLLACEKCLIKLIWTNEPYSAADKICGEYGNSKQLSQRNLSKDVAPIFFTKVSIILEDGSLSKSNFKDKLIEFIMEIDIKNLISLTRNKCYLEIYNKLNKMTVLGILGKVIKISDFFTPVSLTSSDIIIKINSEKEQLNIFQDNQQINTRILIWGKSGSGKTTLLKYLAIQCIEGKFKEECIPIFVPLAEFVSSTEDYKFDALKESRIKNFILNQFRNKVSEEDIEKILLQGRMLLLLDGLDVGSEQNNLYILKEVEKFIESYPFCSYIITCNNIKKYFDTYKIYDKAYEIKGFDKDQVNIFIKNWFKNNNSENDGEKLTEIIANLYEHFTDENIDLDPMTSSFICLQFSQVKNLDEEDIVRYTKKPLQLYKEAISALISDWDYKREYLADVIYKNLPFWQKENLLGVIAVESFLSKRISLSTPILKACISQFIDPFQNINNKSKPFDMEENILRSIEIQDGLIVNRIKDEYTFSHSLIRDYFVALSISRTHPSEWENFIKKYEEDKDDKWLKVFEQALELLELRASRLKKLINERRE